MGWGRKLSTWGFLAVLGGLSLLSCERSETTGIATEFSASPAALDFGLVPLGDGNERTLTLLNASRRPLRIADVTSGVASVEVQGERTFSLAPGEERKLTVRFSPAVEGAVVGSLQLHTDVIDALGGIRTVDLTGSGVLSFVESRFDGLDFGNVEVDSTEVLELPLVNNTAVDATARLVFEGEDADEFGSSLSAAPIRVRPGEQVNVPISFHPTRMGAAQAVARIVPCPGCEAILVQLTGNGVAAMLEIAPSRVDFGRVEVGARAEQRVTVRNNGTIALIYRGSRVLKDDAARFRLESEPAVGTSLAPGSGFELLVSFTPNAEGPHKGPLLEVGLRADNAEAPGPKLPLQGSGGLACIYFRPAALDFGPVPEGMTTTRTVRALNRCTEPVSLVDVAVGATEGGYFSLPRPTSGVVLAPGGEVPLAVSFQPRPDAPRSVGELRVRAQLGASSSTAALPLSGSPGIFEPCDYRLAPAPLNFGRTQVGSRMTLGWTLTNVGPTDCFVGGMGLAAGSDAAFSAAPVEGRVLQPKERLLLQVSFQPSREGPASALAEAWVNHPTLGHPTAAISGEGVQACVALEPAQVDFGVVKRDCGARERTLVVHNRCTLPVVVSRIDLEPDHSVAGELRLAGVPNLPLTLAPAAQAFVSLAYTPADDGPDAAALRIATDRAGALSAGVGGLGLERPTQTDRFVQESQGQVDVLFVVDNSGSMMEEQQSLGQNFASFMSAAQRTAVDYQIAVTTTGIEGSPGGWSTCPGGAEGGEAGRFFPVDNSSPRIIRAGTPNAAAVFAQNVRVGYCHWNEQGLEAAYRALSAPLITSADDPRTSIPNDGNLGFLRDEARLVLVFLSDEEDFSPQSVSFYETFFRGVKHNDETLLSVLAIVGPRNLATCPTSASSGTRYLALAEATGGATDSICTPNWAATLETLSSTAFGPKRTFPLSQSPETAAAIVVQVNGLPVTAGWRYDPRDNEVIFDADAVPSPGAVVEITYPLGC